MKKIALASIFFGLAVQLTANAAYYGPVVRSSDRGDNRYNQGYYYRGDQSSTYGTPTYYVGTPNVGVYYQGDAYQGQGAYYQSYPDQSYYYQGNERRDYQNPYHENQERSFYNERNSNRSERTENRGRLTADAETGGGYTSQQGSYGTTNRSGTSTYEQGQNYRNFNTPTYTRTYENQNPGYYEVDQNTGYSSARDAYSTDGNVDKNKTYPQDTFATEQDRMLNQKIRDKISNGMFWNSNTDLKLNTVNGVVNVSGPTKSADDQNKILDEIRKVDSVKSVNSQMTIRK